MRSLFLLPLSVFLLLSLSGCPKTPDELDEPEALPFEGVSVSIGHSLDLDLAAAFGPVLDEWAARTGASWTIGDLSEPSDVMILPIDAVPSRVLEDSFEPLPKPWTQPGDIWLGIRSGARQVCSPRSKPTLLPLAMPTYSLYFRDDLLKKAGKQPPGTWSEYRELVADLENWAPGLIALEPWAESVRSTTYLAHVAPFAKHPENYSMLFDYSTGSPAIDTPGFADGTAELLKLWPLLDEASLSATPEECRRRLLAGEVAITLTCESTTPLNAELNRVDGISIAMTPLPGSDRVYNSVTETWDEGMTAPVGVVGFDAVFLGCREDASDAAWDLVRELYDRQPLELWPRPLRGLMRRGSEPRMVAAPGLQPQEISRLAKAEPLTFTSDIVVEFPIVERQTFRTILAEELEKLLQSETEPETFFEEVTKRWQRVIDEIGKERFIDSYRLGLGLRASSAK